MEEDGPDDVGEDEPLDVEVDDPEDGRTGDVVEVWFIRQLEGLSSR